MPTWPATRPRRFGLRLRRHRRQGNIVVFFAVLLPVLIGMIAFAIDLGMVAREHVQIQQSADAAALAGAAVLAQARQAGNRAAVDDTVAAYAAYNRVGLDPVPAGALLVELGHWEASTRTWSAAALGQANAVRVTAEMPNRPRYFGQIFHAPAPTARASSTGLAQASTREIYCLLDGTEALQQFSRGSAVAAGFTRLTEILTAQHARDRLGVLLCSEAGGEPRLEFTLARNFTRQGRGIEEFYSQLEGGSQPPLPELAIGEALDAARGRFAATGRGRSGWMAILVAAGSPSGTRDVAEAAAACQAAGIVVHTVAVGDDAPVALLSDVAAATGGRHFALADSTDLAAQVTAAFEELAHAPLPGVALVE